MRLLNRIKRCVRPSSTTDIASIKNIDDNIIDRYLRAEGECSTQSKYNSALQNTTIFVGHDDHMGSETSKEESSKATHNYFVGVNDLPTDHKQAVRLSSMPRQTQRLGSSAQISSETQHAKLRKSRSTLSQEPVIEDSRLRVSFRQFICDEQETYSAEVYDRSPIALEQTSTMMETYVELMTYKLCEMSIHQSNVQNVNTHLARAPPNRRREMINALTIILSDYNSVKKTSSAV